MAQFALAAIAIGGAIIGSQSAKKADKARVKQANAQRHEVIVAVEAAFAINSGNIERSRIRTKEIQSRALFTSLGSLRAQTATRVGRSSTALLTSVLASGFLAASDTDIQSVAQLEVLKTQADSQIAGLAVAQATPGIALIGGLQGLQQGLSIATSFASLSASTGGGGGSSG